MTLLRKIWAVWKAVAHRLGQIQTAILLTLIYHTAFAIVRLLSRAQRQDPLGLRSSDGPSYWVALPETTSTLERAHKQF